MTMAYRSPNSISSGFFATVPPTVAICREWFGAAAGPIVFGWVFASHQLGAAVAATGAGLVRDVRGSYTLAWLIAGALCLGAAVLSFMVPRVRETQPLPSPSSV